MSFITLGSPSRVRIGTCHICLYLLVYGISARRWERDAHCPRRISTLELLIDFTDGWNPQRGLADSDDRINAASYLRSYVWNGEVRNKKSKIRPGKFQSTKIISDLIRFRFSLVYMYINGLCLLLIQQALTPTLWSVNHPSLWFLHLTDKDKWDRGYLSCWSSSEGHSLNHNKPQSQAVACFWCLLIKIHWSDSFTYLNWITI